MLSLGMHGVTGFCGGHCGPIPNNRPSAISLRSHAKRRADFVWPCDSLSAASAFTVAPELAFPAAFGAFAKYLAASVIGFGPIWCEVIQLNRLLLCFCLHPWEIEQQFSGNSCILQLSD